jgi:hypothetical protein
LNIKYETAMKLTRLATFGSALALLLVFWAVPTAADLVSVAEFLPEPRTQSNGIGVYQPSNSDIAGSQTFIPSDTGVLQRVRLVVENRVVVNGIGLTLDIRPAVPGTDVPDLSGAPLASRTLSPGQVPIYFNNDGFFAPIEQVLTTFDFSAGPTVNLMAGTEYALVLSAVGAMDQNGENGYGWYTGPSFSNPAPDVNYAESTDGGMSFSSYPFNFDATYQVMALVPEPSSTALMMLAGLVWTCCSTRNSSRRHGGQGKFGIGDR